MLKIEDWVPTPGHPLPVPRMLDDRGSFTAREVKQVLEWMDTWRRERAFDEVKIEGHVWRISELRCPLTHKVSGAIVAVHKFVCARPKERHKLIIVGPYVGCYRHGERNRSALV